MAENKKSFVLYGDLIHTVRKLPKAKAGELFLTILAYVNDENPEVKDPIVDLVFEPIKRQLKRDLQKYEGKKKQWSDAGKASAESKKLAKERLTDSTNVEKRSTVSTVNVNDTVTVNDNVNVITQKGNLRDIFFTDLPNSKDFELTAIDLKLSKEVLKTYIPKFKEAAEPSYPNFPRFTAHFKNWVKKKLNETPALTVKKKNQPL